MFHLRRFEVEARWKRTRTRPGIGDKITANIFNVLPKVGPLNVFQFHVPTDEREQLFVDSLNATVVEYEAKVASRQLDLPNLNLDTGRMTRPGEYRYGDLAFALLLHRLARTKWSMLTPQLRDYVLDFYGDTAQNSLRVKKRKWRRIEREVKELQAARPAAAPMLSSSIH